MSVTSNVCFNTSLSNNVYTQFTVLIELIQVMRFFYMKIYVTRTRHARHGPLCVWHYIFFFSTSQIENNNPHI
jgi:hypothetical protein